jgi:hypothetical protein
MKRKWGLTRLLNLAQTVIAYTVTIEFTDLVDPDCVK